MKKILFLLLISITTYGQARFPEGVRISGGQPTVTGTNFLTSVDATGLLTKIAPVNLPFPKPALTYGVDFYPLLGQDPSDLTVKKRDLAPELNRLDPAIIPIYAWGDSLTAEYLAPPFPTSYPTLLTAQLGYTVTNKGVGGETSTQIKNRLVADVANYSKSVIIWAGRNNLMDPTTVKADIATMISTIGHTRYLVVSIFNASDEGIGTLRYTQVTTLNNDLKTLYGNKYVPLREYLVSKYNPSVPQDVTDHNNDVIPSTLRLDNIHINTTGNTYVAEFLFQRAGNLYNQTGYLQGKDFEGYLKNATSVIHTTGNETKADVLTLSSSPIISSETASTIASFDATKNLKSLSTATYPSLPELATLKGINTGSSVQVQLNGKQATLTNPVTGTGTSGQVSYWNGTNTQTGSSNLQWDNTNKRLGINVFSTPQSGLDVRAEGTDRLFGITMYSNTLASGATIIGTRIGGTKASNSAILANTLMTSIQTTGHNGVGSGNITGRIDIFSKQDFTTINESTYMTFSTSPVGGIIAAERLRIDSDGRALFGTTTNNGVDQVQVTGTISATVDATTSTQLVRKGQLDLKANNLLTGYVSGAGTVAGTDTVLQGIQKLAGNDLLNVKTTGSQNIVGIKSFTTTTAATVDAGLVWNNNSSDISGMIQGVNNATGRRLLNLINASSTGEAIYVQNQSNGVGVSIASGATGTNGIGLLIESQTLHGASTIPFKITESGVQKAFFSYDGKLTAEGLILKTYTVATLPTPTPGTTAYATVTDATAPTYLGALTGGGVITCPVFYNGTIWVSH